MSLNWSFALSAVLSTALWTHAALADGDLRSGQRFEIVGKMYAYGVAENLDTRKISTVHLKAFQLTGPEIISEQFVPKGSMMTIIGSAPKAFLQFLYSDRYIVRIAGLPMPAGTPAGTPVILEMCCGVQSKSSPLNPAIFKPLP